MPPAAYQTIWLLVSGAIFCILSVVLHAFYSSYINAMLEQIIFPYPSYRPAEHILSSYCVPVYIALLHVILPDASYRIPFYSVLLHVSHLFSIERENIMKHALFPFALFLKF